MASYILRNGSWMTRVIEACCEILFYIRLCQIGLIDTKNSVTHLLSFFLSYGMYHLCPPPLLFSLR